MASKAGSRKSGPAPGRSSPANPRRSRKTMEIDTGKLAKARRILGSDSDTQTVDRALDMVIANREIEAAMESAFGSMPDFRIA